MDTFVFQVASSVDALFKCTQTEAEKEQVTIGETQSFMMSRVSTYKMRLYTIAAQVRLRLPDWKHQTFGVASNRCYQIPSNNAIIRHSPLMCYQVYY